MIGILLATHGSFCEGIQEGAGMVMGKVERLRAVKLQQNDDVSAYQKDMLRLVEELDDGDGVLILVDLLGGSPYNMSAACICGRKVECVTGLNLPMLLEALEHRGSATLKELVTICMAAAKNGVVDVRSHLNI